MLQLPTHTQHAQCNDAAQRIAVQCHAVQRSAMSHCDYSLYNLCMHKMQVQFTCAGDTTVQLLWRLQHGELPTTTDTKQAVVLIGTNDLTAYHLHQASFCAASELSLDMLAAEIW